MAPPPPISPAFEALLDQGRLAEARGQVQAARELYERGLHSLEPDSSAHLISLLLLGVGRTHLAARNAGAAFDCVEAILALPPEPGMDESTVEALDLRGRLYWSEGDLASAIADFTEVTRRANLAGYHALSALGSAHLSTLAAVEGRPGDAVSHAEAARTRWLDAGDDNAASRATARLAALYAELKRWNAAEQAYADSAALATRRGDEHLLAVIELGRAEMALDRSNVERAHASTERALELARRVDAAPLVARALVLAGVVARELGDLARAGRLLDQGGRLAQEHQELLLVAETARERADLLAREDRHAEAVRALNQAYRALAQLRVRGADPDTARRLRRLDDGFVDVVRRWAQRIEAKDHATAGHCERVADLTCEIARRMGVERHALLWYRIGAYLHDIGKLEVPSSILNKSGRLTPEEWALVKRHPAAGARMLRDVDFPWEVRPIVESHHECWDGSGYPHGLAGEEIPLAARIFTVADVYDALVTRRSFKVAVAHDEALDVMRRDVGRQFDPAVFRVFEEVVRDGVAIPGVTSAASHAARQPTREPPLLDDSLTAVADRASWMQRATHILASRRGAEQPAALLLVDLDHFARVNSTYGRLQGDDLLWAVAKVLQRGLRSGDLVGRRGSDEFVILLPATGPEVALEVALRLREACAQLRAARRDAPEEHIAVSVSIAVAGAPQDGDTTELLLAAADRALFRAKRDGRDRVVVADHADAGAARQRLDFGAFVAREDELRTLVAQLDQASRGDARLVSLTGEEGIGKTAMVRHLDPEIRLRTGLAIHAQCLDGDQLAAYAPWTEVVSQLYRAGHLGGDEWRALSQLVPEIPPPHGGDDWALTPSLLREEIVRAVRRVARERFLVLVFEDVQWADPASWGVLDALLAALDGERLFILLTLRPGDARGAADWRRRLTQHPRASSLALQRFSLEELRRWTQVVFRDADPGDEFPRVLHAYTEGIPLHVVHVVRALAEAGGIWYGGTRWEWRPLDAHQLPPGIAFILERRLQRLSPPARAILTTAGVLGVSFSMELLLAAANLPQGQVLAALDEGEAAGVVARGTTDGSFTFTHSLLADACTREVPERQRQRLHEVAARLLELRAPSAVASITSHYHAAGLDAEAYRYALAAADRAARVSAHDQAIEALQVAQRHAPTPRDLATLRARLAVAGHDAGRYEYAEAMCDLALEWIDGAATHQRATQDGATHEGELPLRQLRERIRVRRGKHPLRAMETLRVLLAPASPHDGEGRPAPNADVQLAAAALAASLADWSHCAALARKALDALGSAATSAQRADALRLLGIARYGAAPADAIALVRESLTHADAGNLPGATTRARLVLGDLHLRAGHFAHAEEFLGVALDEARSAHSAPLAARVSRSLGELRARQGLFGEAAQWLGDAERICTALGDVPGQLRTSLVAAHLARDHGERERAHLLYDGAAARARELDVNWIELTALAGAALTNGGPDAPETWARWDRASELLAAAQPDWWFPGRELVDGLALQIALGAGHSGAAFDLFARSLRRLDAVDPYAGAWLVAECSDGLERAGLPAIAVTRRLALERAQALDFGALEARLATPEG